MPNLNTKHEFHPFFHGNIVKVTTTVISTHSYSTPLALLPIVKPFAAGFAGEGACSDVARWCTICCLLLGVGCSRGRCPSGSTLQQGAVPLRQQQRRRQRQSQDRSCRCRGGRPLTDWWWFPWPAVVSTSALQLGSPTKTDMLDRWGIPR